MKYIKTYNKLFENTYQKNFWQIPTGKKFICALKKIGAPDINDIIDTIGKNKEKVIYFGYDKFGKWEWNDVTKSGKILFLEDNYIYQGEIEVEDWEVNANKFNV